MKAKSITARCRHRRSWIIGTTSGYIEWCYECGAIRHWRHKSESEIAPFSAWQKPVGKGGKNPWETFFLRSAPYRKAWIGKVESDEN